MSIETQHILSLSYGKDSLACLGAIEKLGWPLDRIVHVEVWATDTIPADFPDLVAFKEKADKIIQQRYGIAVEHIYAKNRDETKYTYEQYFYHVNTKGSRVGQITGWPRVCGSGCILLKTDPYKKYVNAMQKAGCDNIYTYLGIAADENERLARHSLRSDVKLPLVAVGWDEQQCRHWCEENNLLAPTYSVWHRGVLVLS